MKVLALATLVMACTPPSRIDPKDRTERARDAGPDRCLVGDAVAAAPPAAVPPSIARAPVPQSPLPIATVTLAQPKLPPTTAIAAAPAAVFVLAATEDGRTAVSSDGRSTLRLWPTLDGTREPVMLAVTIAPIQLAIVRDGHDVVIAAVDQTGQLELLRTTELGALASRVRLDLGQRALTLVAAEHAFVVLRDDQTLVAIDRDAHVIGALVPKPGEHLASLASRSGRVLAMLANEQGARAQWISVGDTLAFGATSPAMAIDPASVALAPGGKRIAAFARSHKGLAILDIASGKVVTWVVPLSDEELVNPFVRGFVDDTSLLFGSQFHHVAWWTGEGTVESDVAGSTPVAACDHHLLIANGGGLILATPDGDAKALGYMHATITSAARAGNGWLVTNGASAFQVDDRFRAKKTFTLPEADAGHGWLRVTALDAHHVIAEGGDGIVVIDLTDDRHSTKLVASGYDPLYEPATGVLAFKTNEPSALHVALRDPKTGAFSDPVELTGGVYTRAIRLLDPALSGGKAAVVIGEAEDLSLQITDVRVRMHDGAVAVSEQSRDHPAIPNQRFFSPDVAKALGYVTAIRRPNEDRSLFAEVGAGRITLRDASGKVRWTVAQPGVVGAAWSALGDLVVFGSGMARIDLETGALLDRQCGWQFGLTEATSGGVAAGAELCEAP